MWRWGVSIAFAKGKTEVCAVDIDYTRIKRSKVRALEEGTEVNFLVADGLHLPFRSSVFDVVICNDLIEHVPEPRHLIDEITRVMKGQGLLYLSAPNRLSPYQIIHDGIMAYLVCP
ncbi:MAG: class I SAM-dependent methyltransferase [Candidatus Bathyarchaeia archaeon]